jgi:tight adherence protein C
MLSFDQNMLTVMFAVFFLVIFLFIFGLMRYFNMRQQKKEMVEKIKGDGFSEYKEIFDQDAESVLSQSQETRSGLVKVFDFLGRLFIGQAKTKSTSERKKFLRAGLRNKNAETAFWGAKIILPFIYLGVFIVLKATVLESMDMTRTLLILVVGSLFVFYLPDIWIKQITDKRKERLLKALPDSLDLLVVCVEAGMGLDGAIKRVGD